MTEEQPLVSIVIPCYNHAQFVQETIQSVIDQDYENIELIIIDDGSKDNSVEVIQEMIPACEERFVRFEFRYRPNKGLCATLNEALEWCEGEYFSALASDDIALKHKVSFLVNKMESDCCDAAFGVLRGLSEGKQAVRTVNKIINHSFDELVFQINIPSAPAAMVKISALREVGGYNENLWIEDWYMWLLLASKNYKLVTYPEVLTLYRRHESNMTNNLEKMHIGRMEILKEFSCHPLASSAINKEYLYEARRSAYKYPFRSLQFLIKYKRVDFKVLFVFLKILTPAFIIDIKREF